MNRDLVTAFVNPRPLRRVSWVVLGSVIVASPELPRVDTTASLTLIEREIRPYPRWLQLWDHETCLSLRSNFFGQAEGYIHHTGSSAIAFHRRRVQLAGGIH